VSLKSIKTKLIIFLVCFIGFLALQEKEYFWFLPVSISVITAASAEAAIPTLGAGRLS
jgi:hypothetical protein